MKKKSQSISINTIVVAAIALVVMILIVMIFTNSFAGFKRSADSCQSSGGRCVKDDECISLPDDITIRQIRNDLICYGFDGERAEDEVCCVII